MSEANCAGEEATGTCSTASPCSAKTPCSSAHSATTLALKMPSRSVCVIPVLVSGRLLTAGSETARVRVPVVIDNQLHAARACKRLQGLLTTGRVHGREGCECGVELGAAL